MVRGRVVQAFADHPFGPVLVVLIAGAGVAGVVEAFAGVSIFHRLRPRWLHLAAPIIALLAGWGLKVAIGMADASLPIR